MTSKAPEAFRTISEVADDLGLRSHVLRFWETKFTQIKPMKRGGQRRYYRPDDVDLLRGIKHLLYDEGYTIRGVQRLLKENGQRFVIAIGAGEDPLAYLPDETANASEDHDEETQELDEEADASTSTAPGTSAKSVAELNHEAEIAKSPGLLSRLMRQDEARGGDKETSMGEGMALTSEERNKLQTTLHDLLECKRLLDQVR